MRKHIDMDILRYRKIINEELVKNVVGERDGEIIFYSIY